MGRGGGLHPGMFSLTMTDYTAKSNVQVAQIEVYIPEKIRLLSNAIDQGKAFSQWHNHQTPCTGDMIYTVCSRTRFVRAIDDSSPLQKYLVHFNGVFPYYPVRIKWKCFIQTLKRKL